MRPGRRRAALLGLRRSDGGELWRLPFTDGDRFTVAGGHVVVVPGTSASWNSAVTGGLVAVTGAADDHPFVTVYDASTGRLRGRFPSWLSGAGDTWVAVTHGSGTADQLTVEFWTFSSR